MVLCPRTVIISICKEIRKFLWQGGKVQSKKFHLVKWETVKRPKFQGGLGIRDPELMCKAMGAKLVWRLVTGKKEWWKEVIRKKYIKRPRSKLLDRAWTGKGTSLWQLCKASLSVILENSYWILGNGKKINVWTNSILGQLPRSSLPDLPPLSDWARDHGIISLFDLSCWDSQGRWSGWKHLSPPAHLENATAALFLSLHGLSPTSLSIPDRLGWAKSGQYNVK